MHTRETQTLEFKTQAHTETFRGLCKLLFVLDSSLEQTSNETKMICPFMRLIILYCMCLKAQITIRYLTSPLQQKPLNSFSVWDGLHYAHFDNLTGNHWSLFLQIMFELENIWPLFDLTARSHHSSTDVDTLHLALSSSIFLCRLPSHQLFSTGEF